MSSLAHCFERFGIHPLERAEIRKAAKEYRNEGFAAQEANQRAVSDYIKLIEENHIGMKDQIKAELTKRGAFEKAVPVNIQPSRIVPVPKEEIARTPEKAERGEPLPGYPEITKAEDYWNKTPDEIKVEEKLVDEYSGVYGKERNALINFYVQELKKPLSPEKKKLYNDLIERYRKENAKSVLEPFEKEQEKFLELAVAKARERGLDQDHIPEFKEAVDEVIGNEGTKKISDQVDDIISAFVKDQTPVEKALGEKELPTKAIQHSLNQMLKAADNILRTGRPGKLPNTTIKKAIENSYSALKVHGPKVGIEVPPAGTFFSLDKYRKIAGDIQVAVGQKYGSHPTEEMRAKREAARIESEPVKQPEIDEFPTPQMIQSARDEHEAALGEELTDRAWDEIQGTYTSEQWAESFPKEYEAYVKRHPEIEKPWEMTPDEYRAAGLGNANDVEVMQALRAGKAVNARAVDEQGLKDHIPKGYQREGDMLVPPTKKKYPDLTVTGQMKPVPDRPAATYVVHRAKPVFGDTRTYKVNIRREEGGFASVDGKGNTPEEAYEGALYNYDEMMAKRVKPVIPPETVPVSTMLEQAPPGGWTEADKVPTEKPKPREAEAGKAYFDLGVKHAQTGQKYSPPIVGEEQYKKGFESVKKVVEKLLTEGQLQTEYSKRGYFVAVQPGGKYIISDKNDPLRGNLKIFAKERLENIDQTIKDYEGMAGPVVSEPTTPPGVGVTPPPRTEQPTPQVTPPGMAPAEIPPEKTPWAKTVYGQNYNKLTKLFDKWGLGRPEDFRGYQKLKVPGGKGAIMDLNVEYLRNDENGNPIFGLSHNYEQEGDLVPDPDMEVRILKDGAIEAMTFQDYRSYTQVYPEPGKVDQRAKKDLNSFLGTWLKNIGEQGHAVVPEKAETTIPETTLTLESLQNALKTARGDAKSQIEGAIRSFESGDIEGARLLAKRGQAVTGTDLGFGSALEIPKEPRAIEGPNIDWDAVMNIKDIVSGAARVGLTQALANAEKDNWGEASRHLEEAHTVLMDTNPELATRLRGIIYEGTEPTKPLTNAEKESIAKLKEGERYAGEISEPSADTTKAQDDRIRTRGEGAENVPAPKKDWTTEDLRTGPGPESSGQLRGSGNKGASSFAETENLPGEPTEPKRGHEKGVGRRHGDVAGLQRPRRGTDHWINPADLVREGSWRNQAKTNLDIIEIVKKLEAENRQATPEEQKLLAKYTGWGASEVANKMFPGYAHGGEIFPNWADQEWKPLVERLVNLLTPEEIKTAANSTQFAHYTSVPVIRSIYRALEKFGFAGGRILEPGMGVGHFFGLLPDSMRGPSVYTGIEYDKSTASIAKYLYPNQNVLYADYTKQKLPNDFFDLAIGNPPFSSTKILVDPDYKKYRFNLHEYFFAKSLDKVRPGGLLTFITSRFTMDKVDDKARAYLMDRADLIGAIRLPQTAFKENAGTEVVTDVLFFRKKVPGEETVGKRWAELKEIKTPEGPFHINEYFIDHPEMILGKNSGQGSMYGQDEYTVLPLEGDIEEHFANAVENLPENVYSIAKQPPEIQGRAVIERDFNPTNRKEGGLYLSDKDEIMIVESGAGIPLQPTRDIGEHGRSWLRGYVGIRDAVKKSHYNQLNDGPWEVSLEDLQKKYKEFVKTYGRINEYTTYETKEIDEDGDEIKVERRRYKYGHLFKNDIEFPLVTSLEIETETGDIIDGPALSGRTLKKPTPREIRTAPDALAVSLDSIGRLDLEHIGGLLNKPTNVVTEQLGDLIYKDPSRDAHILADEYLSGDVVSKLEEARIAAETDPQYQRNVEALIKAQPLPLTPMQVTVNLGAPWVPPTIVTDFGHEVLGLPPQTEITYNPTDNSWEIGTKAETVPGYSYRRKRRGGPQALRKQQLRGATSEWGTPERGPNEILESILNSKTIKITWVDEDRKTHLDVTGTAAANDIAKKMKARFKNWVWEDAGRAKELIDLWNSTENNISSRKFDGSHLTTPGVTLSWKWHDHQKRAIWRIIQSGNTYINHAVGAGKTAAYIAAGMEMKRMGLVNKPMYAVPRSVLQQFANEFQELYPMANIMVADEENFHMDNRRRFIAQATLNNPDAIIITHSVLGLLRMREENIAPVRDSVLNELRDALADLEESSAGRIRIKQMERRIDKSRQRFDSMIQRGDNVVTFEDMGVDFLFVDEAHLFRKLDFTTNRQAKGVDPVGSQRAMDLYIKTKWLDGQKLGRSFVFGSGTPVTNTIGELYTVMRYFMEPKMEKEGIRHFDAWANIFGDVRTDPEMNAAGRYEMVERFSKFVNVSEMMSRVRTFMDVVTMSQLAGLVRRPPIRGELQRL